MDQDRDYLKEGLMGPELHEQLVLCRDLDIVRQLNITSEGGEWGTMETIIVEVICERAPHLIKQNINLGRLSLLKCYPFHNEDRDEWLVYFSMEVAE